MPSAVENGSERAALLDRASSEQQPLSTTTFCATWAHVVVLGLVSLGVGLTRFQTLNLLVLNMTCAESGPVNCNSPEEESKGAAQVTLVTGVSGLASFVTFSFLSAWTDVVGRRPVYLANIVLLAADAFACAYAPTLTWLLVLHTLASLGGGYLATLALGFAMVADATPASRRSVQFGILEGVLYIGLAAGPLSGGAIASLSSYRNAFIVSGALLAGSALVAAVSVPESLREEHRRRRLSWKEANPLGWVYVFAQRRLWVVVGLACFFAWTTLMGNLTALTLFLYDSYGWNAEQQGILYTVLCLAFALALTIMLKPVGRCMGDRWTSVMSCLVGALSGVVLAMTGPIHAAWLVYLGAVINAGGALFSPTLRSVLSSTADPSHQATVLGALGSLETFCFTVGPIAYGYLYQLLLRYQRTYYIFAFSAVLVLVSGLLCALGLKSIPSGGARDRQEQLRPPWESDSGSAD